LATRWNTLKPTWFEYSGESICLRLGDILPFKIRENLVDKAFLINELHSDYVQEQLESYRLGTTIPFIRKNDLLDVVVRIPSFGTPNSLELQKAKFQGIFEEIIKSKEKESGYDKKFSEVIESQIRDFQSLKHTIRQYLSPLKSNVSGTRKFLKRNEGKSISLGMIYSRNLDQTLDQHLMSIEGIIDSINKLLLGNEQKQFIRGKTDLVEIIHICQRKFKQEDIFYFTEPEIDIESLLDENENPIKPTIGLNSDQFESLFSNVVDNAVNHGFRVKKSGYIVRVSIKHSDGCMIMIISNNGQPFEEGFTIKDLTTLGEKTTDSSGTGTGGADIKKIVESADGTFDIVSNPTEDIFKVSYIFKFPLIIEE
jgi:type I restriction enzyme M protein